VTKIYLAAMSRADAGPYDLEKLPPFYFYVDEFQNFANESFASILSEARKYNLALTVAHQYVEQMEDEVKAAVFGNVGTMIVFRVGATDAEMFEKEFAPVFTMDDIVNLSAHQIYLRLMIDGVGSQPFSAKTLDPVPLPATSHAQQIISYTRSTYGRPRFEVEDEIVAFYAPIIKEPKKQSKDDQSKDVGNTPTQATKNDEHPKAHDDSRSQHSQAQVKNERTLQVRKITDKTPLPPKRIEQRREEKTRVQTKDDLYSANRSIEEEFHKPPKHHQEEKSPIAHVETMTQTENQSPLKHISVPTFDDRQPLSLKDALQKAMNDFKSESGAKEIRDQASSLHTNQTRRDGRFSDDEDEGRAKSIELKVKKEVDEDVLRKLLEDE
jgi:hypothetical protein